MAALWMHLPPGVLLLTAENRVHDALLSVVMKGSAVMTACVSLKQAAKRHQHHAYQLSTAQTGFTARRRQAFHSTAQTGFTAQQ